MLLDLSFDDPVLVAGRWIAIALLISVPWIVLRVNSIFFRKSLWVIWFMAISFLAALYLGLLTYHYIGPQLGFSVDGNPMNWWMITLGLISVIPFILAAKKGSIEKPFDLAVIVAFGVLLLVGPPAFNSVALSIYTQGGGEFDSGQGDYAGEVSTPTNRQSWDVANGVSLVVCNLIPLLVFITIWLLSRRSTSNLKSIDDVTNSRIQKPHK